MSTYRFELSWDNLTLTLPTANAATVGSGLRLAFSIQFTDSGAVTHTAAPQLDMLIHSFGGGPTYEFRTQQQFTQNGVGPDPINFGSPNNAVVEANGQNGHAFLTVPVTLAITLDDTAHQVTVEGPLGTQTYSFAALGWAVGAIGAPSLQSIGLGITDVDGTENVDFSASLYNFSLSKDSVRIAGAQMGTVQPGTWSNAWHVDFGLGTAGISGTVTGTESREVSAIHFAQTGLPIPNAAWFRTFAGGLGDVDTVIALLCEARSGALTYARITKQQIDAVEVGTSEDSGHTWTTQLVGRGAGSVYAAPSLAESPDGAINLFVSDRSTPTTRWFRSTTQGTTWEDAGILLSILPWATSTSPRVFTLPTGFFLVSYNHAGHWFLAVYEGGQTTSAAIQSTDMGANSGGIDTFPGLHVDALTNIYAARAPSVLNEEIYRSTDLGVDWSSVLAAPLGSKQLMTTSSAFSPFIWKLWQDGAGGITVAGAEDFGSVYLFGAIVAFAGAADQYCGLSVLPKGFPIFVFQTYHAGTDSWSVDGFRSEDLGRTWIAN